MDSAGMHHLTIAARSLLGASGNGPTDVDPTTGHGPEWGKAAPSGLLVIVLMGVAVYFLIKSLNRNLKKVPQSFAAPDSTVGGGGQIAAGGPAAPFDRDASAGSTAEPDRKNPTGSGPPP